MHLGLIEGTRLRLRLVGVLGLMGFHSLDRIVALQNSPAVRDLAEQMRGTEGQCAPVYFLRSAEQGVAPSLVEGYEALAAAQLAGIETISVICIAARDSERLQSQLVAMKQVKPEPETDDDLIYRVMRDD
ncbi:hypothetical protein FBR43_07190 [Sphingomonas baiyangensis]|uniref:Uncharacterized protein n=1 Tax=Sphingomonas baiyangensis TaxID=2572576 RepID=A0A4U1L306_9SPHN|nr:hypothetical protein FBR43_07190 [Sphingomonas baiyangensis]